MHTVRRALTLAAAALACSPCAFAAAAPAPAPRPITVSDDAEAAGALAALLTDPVAAQRVTMLGQLATVGCGTDVPVALLASSAPLGGSPRAIRFQVLSGYSGVVAASQLSVHWANVDTGERGVTALDEATDAGYPTLAGTAPTGAGPIAAVLAGGIEYPSTTCHVLPSATVFSVPRSGPLPVEQAYGTPR